MSFELTFVSRDFCVSSRGLNLSCEVRHSHSILLSTAIHVPMKTFDSVGCM